VLGLDITVIVVVVIAILVLFSGIKTVPQGFAYTVERFGRYTKTLTPGLNMIVPFVDRIGRKINIMEQVLDIPTQEVITRDNASVSADAVSFYQVLNAAEAAYQVSELEQALLNLTMTNIRSVMGSMDLDELLSNRDAINDRCCAWSTRPPPLGHQDHPRRNQGHRAAADLVEAMGRQMKAEREKRAEVLEAEGCRNAQILRAEGAKQSAILEAEGRRDAAFVTPRPANASPKPKPRRHSWCRRPLPKATSPPSTISSRRNTPKRLARSHRRTTRRSS
jgi:regulator of protease activity HflC (stomatin/prohibitin superfamily)